VLDLARTLKDAARLGGRGLLAFGPFCMSRSLDTRENKNDDGLSTPWATDLIERLATHE